MVWIVLHHFDVSTPYSLFSRAGIRQHFACTCIHAMDSVATTFQSDHTCSSSQQAIEVEISVMHDSDYGIGIGFPRPHAHQLTLPHSTLYNHKQR